MNKILHALSDPTRRKILKMLREKEMTAGEIAQHFSITKPSLSKHFRVLEEANLIYGEKVGRQIYYYLNLSVLEETLMSLIELFKLKEGD